MGRRSSILLKNGVDGPSTAPGLQQVAHFQIRETLGFGALGTVYLAWDTKLNRVVALKVLSEDIKDPNLRERFHLEARAIAALKHPNIVSVLDFSDANAPAQFIALERLEGKSTFDYQWEHGPMPEQVVLCIAHEVTAALEYAHSQNVVHRDIKPDNVVLESNRVVLIDFGAMRLTDNHAWIPESDVDEAPMAIGTPGFMAPEQLLGTDVDQRADLFGVGALMYHLVTGVAPYDPSSNDAAKMYAEIKRGNFRDPRDLQPLLTPPFADVVAGCLEVRPAARPSNAAKLRLQLAAMLRHHGISDVKAVLKQYVDAPSLDSHVDVRTVDTLTHDLRLALLRDFQRAVHADEHERVVHATRRLRRMREFLEADDRDARNRRDRPRLLRDRLVRRHRWFLIGFLVALVGSAALVIARPSLVTRTRAVIDRVVVPLIPGLSRPTPPDTPGPKA